MSDSLKVEKLWYAEHQSLKAIDVMKLVNGNILCGPSNLVATANYLDNWIPAFAGMTQ